MAGDYKQFDDYLTDGPSADPYGEKDYSNYANKYCIYWYKYEEGYVDETLDVKLMPNGWRKLTPQELEGPNGEPYIGLPSRFEDGGNPILNKEGKEIYSPQLGSD
jgi:hypothetical protein